MKNSVAMDVSCVYGCNKFLNIMKLFTSCIIFMSNATLL